MDEEHKTTTGEEGRTEMTFCSDCDTIPLGSSALYTAIFKLLSACGLGSIVPPTRTFTAPTINTITKTWPATANRTFLRIAARAAGSKMLIPSLAFSGNGGKFGGGFM